MTVKKYAKHLFQVTDTVIIYLMPEVKIRFVDEVKLNFDKFFLQFNVKKKIYTKSC